MTPDLSALPDETALVVNVVLVLGVLVAAVRGWFSRADKPEGGRRESARPNTGAQDNAMLQMLASVLADRSATANLASATRDMAKALDAIAASVDRIERKFAPRADACPR